MADQWHDLGREALARVADAPEAAAAASGVANAAYYARRAIGAHLAGRAERRSAALLLAALFAGIAVDAALHLLAGAPAPEAAPTPGAMLAMALRAPLVLATVAVSLAIARGALR